MPWLWDLVDIINSIIFSFRYNDKLKAVEKQVFSQYEKESGMKILSMAQVATEN